MLLPALTPHREALERAIEALKVRGVALSLPRKESREDAMERALAAFHGARGEGHAVYAFTLFRQAPFRKGPVWQISVMIDHREDEPIAAAAIVEELRAVGLPVTWNGKDRPVLDLTAPA